MADPTPRQHAARPEGATTETVRPETVRPETGRGLDFTGIRLAIVGGVIAVLAPLGGFLGGSVVGWSPEAELDPLFVWLFGGLVLGGAGVLLAVLGLLRFVRANRRRL